MCDPATIAVAAVSAGVSAYGQSQQASAQQDAANAIARQNAADQAAQNAGFTARAQAAGAQTTAQKQAMQDTLANESAIAAAQRGGQSAALQNQQDVLGAENRQEDLFRQIGDSAAASLMDQTSAPQLAGSQADWQQRAAELLGSSGVPALTAGATDPNDPSNQVGGTGGDPAVAAALARRAAQAATNIRNYGATVAKVGSYQAPMNLVANAITDNQTNLMPAQAAERLLKAGSDIRLMPSSLQWRNAIDYGNAATNAANVSGQNALNLASLQYRNSTDIANLQQSNATTAAANVAAQAEQNAQYKAMMGNVISGIGQIGLQGAGYYGGVPGFLQGPSDTQAISKIFG